MADGSWGREGEEGAGDDGEKGRVKSGRRHIEMSEHILARGGGGGPSEGTPLASFLTLSVSLLTLTFSDIHSSPLDPGASARVANLARIWSREGSLASQALAQRTGSYNDYRYRRLPLHLRLAVEPRYARCSALQR